jgi:hypothetical protein
MLKCFLLPPREAALSNECLSALRGHRSLDKTLAVRCKRGQYTGPQPSGGGKEEKTRRSKQSQQSQPNYNSPDHDPSGSDRSKNKQQQTTTSTKGAKQRTLHQYSLLHRIITKEDVEEFGNIMPFPRPESVLRIVQQNVANLPSNVKASKSRQFIDFIRRSQASVFTAQEIGLCLRKLPDEDQWCERVFGRLA